jgi:type II secretory pathway component GspD/PulD (secretin)/beta-lactamase regulating signal transducer with metallopeptidase domain
VTPALQTTVETVDEMPTLSQAPAPLPTPDAPVSVPLQERIVSILEPALPYVVLGWLAGVFGLSAWHLGGWTQLQRLKRRMVREIGNPLQHRLKELSGRLGVHRAVGLLESALVEVPTVVGWLRPVILLPASALTGLRPEQLEAILAHELAHVRRYDYLVNIVQTVVEILGFYHPAVWWVSHRIRVERENCCDDLAVRVCGSSLQYAKALACMEEIRHSAGDLALAVTGGSLVTRIARLLGRPAADDRRFAWLPGLVALLLVVGIILPAALVLGTPPSPQAVEPAAVAATHGVAEPNAASPNAENASGSASAQAAQILLDFKIIRVQDNLRVDRETIMQMANALGIVIVLPAGKPNQTDQMLNLTVGEILKRYFVPQPLSAEAGEKLLSLLQSRGYVEVFAKPRVLTNDGRQAQIRVINGERFLRASDPSAKLEKIEYGLVIDATPHVLDANRVNLELMAEVSDLVPGSDFNQPTVIRTSGETNVTAWDNRYLVWAAVTPTAAPAGQEADRRSVYIMVKPRINLPPQGLPSTANNQKAADTHPRQVLLEAHTVTMARDTLQNLGIQWNWPTTKAGASPGPAAGGLLTGRSGPVMVGYLPDQTFTDSLLAALEQLQKNRQVTISSQQIMAQEGRPSRLKAIAEEWFTVTVPAAGPSGQPHTEAHKTDSGTVLAITPQITDDNDIVVEMALEVSERVKTASGDLPILTRRTAKNTITLKNGGTVAVTGLSVNETAGGPGQETAIFVTAHVVQDENETPRPAPQEPGPNVRVVPPASLTPEQIAQMRREYVNSDPMVTEFSKRIVAMERDLVTQQALVKENRPKLEQEQAAIDNLKKKIEAKRQELEKQFDNNLTQQIRHGKRQVLLEARVVAIEPGELPKLEVAWAWPPVRSLLFSSGTTPEARPPVGHVPDGASTTALMMALNRLCEDGRADTVAAPKIMALDGRRVEMKVVQNDWFLMTVPARTEDSPAQAGLRKLESATVLALTPRVTDNNDITLVLAATISDSIPPAGAGNQSFPTRHETTDSITIKDGGTVAVARLAENRTTQPDKPGRELAVFVTARLAPDRAGPSLPTPPPAQTAAQTSPKITATFTDTDLRDILAEISKRTGVNITADITVRPTPVTTELVEAAPRAALQQVLENTPYRFKGLDEHTYLVFRPLSNHYVEHDLTMVLQELAAAAGVPIVSDPNVTGTVTATFENLSLEEALQIVLAGKPYVFKRMPRYYLVGSRPLPDPPQTAETRRIRLNHVQPAQVTQRLSPVFTPYVQIEQPNARDPNDQDNVLLVTGAPALADRIVADIKKIDRVKRQVLLDARVVVMEKGNLLNLGVEWSWPTTQAGAFTSPPIAGSTGTATSAWPYGVQIGYTPDQTFTNSLMTALNLLQKNNQADIIANPKVVAQDGRQAEMKLIREQWNLMTLSMPTSPIVGAELSIPAGRVLTLTPYIGDNNDITLQMAVEVSDSIPKVRDSDPPRTTRRTVKNSVTIQDGGTVAVGGLTENRSKMNEKRAAGLSSIPLIGALFRNKNNDKSSREVAVFVTVHLVPDTGVMTPQAPESGATAIRVPPPTREAGPGREGPDGSEAPVPAETQEQVKPRVQIGARFVAADERLLRDLRGQGVIRGVTSPQETEALHEIGRRLSEGKSLVLTDEQIGLLMRALQQYPDCRMLAAPQVVVRENELLPLGIGSKIPYTAGYEEPNEPAGAPKPRQATLDSGLTFETTAHLVSQDRVRLDCVLRVTTLLGFDEKKYQGRYRYQVPKTEDVVFSLDNPVVPSGGTALTLGPKARLKASGRPQTILILVTPSIVGSKISPAPAPGPDNPPVRMEAEYPEK